MEVPPPVKCWKHKKKYNLEREAIKKSCVKRCTLKEEAGLNGGWVDSCMAVLCTNHNSQKPVPKGLLQKSFINSFNQKGEERVEFYMCTNETPQNNT